MSKQTKNESQHSSQQSFIATTIPNRSYRPMAGIPRATPPVSISSPPSSAPYLRSTGATAFRCPFHGPQLTLQSVQCNTRPLRSGGCSLDIHPSIPCFAIWQNPKTVSLPVSLLVATATTPKFHFSCGYLAYRLWISDVDSWAAKIPQHRFEPNASRFTSTTPTRYFACRTSRRISPAAAAAAADDGSAMLPLMDLCVAPQYRLQRKQSKRRRQNLLQFVVSSMLWSGFFVPHPFHGDVIVSTNYPTLSLSLSGLLLYSSFISHLQC